MRAVQALKICQAAVLPLVLLAHVLAWWLMFPAANYLLISSGVDADGLWIAQLALITGWAVLGPWRWYARWPLAVGAAALLSRPELNPVWNPSIAYTPIRHLHLATLLAMGMMGTAGFILAIVRASGRRVLLLTGPEPQAGALRFSIRTICFITAAAACLVRGGQVVRASLVGQDTVPMYLVIGMTGVGLAVISAIAYWGVLTPGRIWWRLGVLALMVVLCGVVVPLVCARQGEISLIATWMATAAAIITGTLFVLRLGGYRLMKPPAAVAAEPTVGQTSGLTLALRATPLTRQSETVRPEA
ncbi:MAG: hypothetical protein K8T25_05785 [Planctomycetia bacterium]|nr:hypothetical protein [Planctomycetia bacterium]